MKKPLLCTMTALFVSLLLISAGGSNDGPEQRTTRYFKDQLDSLERKLMLYETLATTAPADTLKNYFTACRALYKRIEFVVEYNYPTAAAKINGAPLLEAEASEPEEPTHPTGFQVLEEQVYDELTRESRLVIANEINGINAQVRKLKIYSEDMKLSSAQVFDAIKLNLYRMIAKGSSGFDCPSAQTGITESAEVLASAKEVLGYYGRHAELDRSLEEAIEYARVNGGDFNGFDRAVFISKHMNAVFRSLQLFVEQEQVPYITELRAVRTDAESFFNKGAFVSEYFAPAGTEPASKELIALGSKLFREPMISGNGERSCASCHKPEKAFTDGLAVNSSLLGGQQLLRNTPTLLNSGLQPAQFADSRVAFLEDQVHAVVSNKAEMGGDLSETIGKLKRNKDYKEMFTSAFAKADPWKAENVRKAIAAYVRSLSSLNSRFDRYLRGEAEAINAQEIRGFNLYMGKAKCGTCHYVPLMNGAVPPLYDKIESEVLGVPASKDTINAKPDNDPGKYNLYRMPHQKHSFKTPTLRNIALTAPYMHNGVFSSLEEVVDFYNRGGGAGIGFELPNQTLSADRLQLSVAEKTDLIAFLKTLTDTTIAPAQ